MTVVIFECIFIALDSDNHPGIEISSEIKSMEYGEWPVLADCKCFITGLVNLGIFIASFNKVFFGKLVIRLWYVIERRALILH